VGSSFSVAQVVQNAARALSSLYLGSRGYVLAQDGISYVPFFPLGGGFTQLQSSTLSDVAQRLGATPAQIAIAWLLRRAPNILLIAGTSSVVHLRENLTAAPSACLTTRSPH
jgi:aryl-alcohol dehydrogenase-like predicted oxidoreductase